MILTEAMFGLALPLVLPQTWPSNRLLGVPIEVYEPYVIPPVLTADPRFTLFGVWEFRAKLRDIVTIEGPPEILIGNPGFAPTTAVELIGYGGLTDNWDGEGAIAPSPEAIENALSMLAATPRQLEAPKPMVLASGDVAFYWEVGDAYAEIGFDDSGTYYAYATRPGFDPVHLDDVPVEDEEGRTAFPMDVVEILTSEPLEDSA